MRLRLGDGPAIFNRHRCSTTRGNSAWAIEGKKATESANAGARDISGQSLTAMHHDSWQKLGRHSRERPRAVALSKITADCGTNRTNRTGLTMSADRGTGSHRQGVIQIFLHPASEETRAKVQAIAQASQRHQKANSAKYGYDFQSVEFTGRLNGAGPCVRDSGHCDLLLGSKD